MIIKTLTCKDDLKLDINTRLKQLNEISFCSLILDHST